MSRRHDRDPGNVHHALGFDVHAPKRAQRDATYDTALRTGEYPLRTWKWDRGWLRRHLIRR